jgi:chromosome segregation ATPase
LEALVVATDVSANKSGTVVQAQVKLLDDRSKERNKFVDSEIDKLWGVAYRTNKPAILENQKALENNTVGIKQHTEQLAAQTNLIEQQQDLIVGQQTSVASVVSENKQMLSDLSQQAKDLTQAQTALQSLEGSLAKSLAAVKSLQSDNGDLTTNVDEIQQSLIEIRATSEVLQDSLSTTLAKVNLTSEVALQNGELSQQNSESVAALRAQLTRQEEQVLGQAVADMAQMNLVVDEIQSELAMLQRQIRVVGAMEQTTAQLDERVYLAEQSMDSIITFRQETNRKLDQLATQIRNLQY